MKKITLSALCLVLLLSLAACEKPKSVAGKILGAWQTEWTDDLEGDLDEITINETIYFEPEGNSKSKGTFEQMFLGSVEFDNFKKEAELNYAVHITGEWTIKDRNNIILKYDIKDMQVEVGVGSVETDNVQALSHLVSGNWVGFLLTVADESISNKDLEQSKKIITKYFKTKFQEINKDKKGLNKVVIDDDIMTCKVSGGWFGRKLTYDKVDLDAIPKAVTPQTPAGLPNYDWLSTREVTYADISGMSKADLRIMRNYMFAKHGYRFKSPDLQQYFAQYPWYTPVSDNVIYEMNSFEKNNIEYIKRFE